MAGSAPMTQCPGFWFDILLKGTKVKVHSGTFSRHVSLLFDLEYSNLVWTCISTPSTFLSNFGPIGRHGRQVAILENQQSYWLILLPFTIGDNNPPPPNFNSNYLSWVSGTWASCFSVPMYCKPSHFGKFFLYCAISKLTNISGCGWDGIGIRTAATGLGQQTNNYMSMYTSRLYSVYILDTGQDQSRTLFLSNCVCIVWLSLKLCHRTYNQ
jgi:hypothetical protein